VLRLAFSSGWSRSLVPLLALPGCLVSFNDYPLGDPKLEPVASAGAAGTVGALPGAGRATGGGSGTGDGGAETSTSQANPLLIDDFEDGNAAILPQQGRSGSWYVINDGRGTQTPPAGTPVMPSALVPARGASARGAHTFGGPFGSWGALLGTVFASTDEASTPYDLSGHQGLRLWVRTGATAGTAAKQVRLNLRTPATVTGGDCTACNDHLGAEIPLTAKWTQVEVPFTTLRQMGFGRPMLASVDLKRVLGIELLFPANVSFDLWVDDVELY
jgi:hypothetical protein